MLKTAADRDLVEAVRAAMRGEPFLYPAAVTALIRDYLAREQRGPRADPLSPRELQVLKLIAEAYTSDQIALRAVASAAARSTATARTSWPSSACATASS